MEETYYNSQFEGAEIDARLSKVPEIEEKVTELESDVDEKITTVASLARGLENLKSYNRVESDILNGYFDNNGGKIQYYESSMYNTIDVPCVVGDTFKVYKFAYGDTNWPAVIFADKEGNIVFATPNINTNTYIEGKEVVTPIGATRVIVNNFITSESLVPFVEKLFAKPINKSLEPIYADLLESKFITSSQVMFDANYKLPEYTEEIGYVAKEDDVFKVYGVDGYRHYDIDCIGGEAYSVSTYINAESKIPLVSFYDKEGKVVSRVVPSIDVDTQFVGQIFFVPQSATKMVVNRYNYSGGFSNIFLLDTKANKLVDNLYTYEEISKNAVNGFYDIQGNNAVFYANNAYRTIVVDCAPNEKYKVSSFLFGSSKWPSIIFLGNQYGVIVGTTERIESDTYFNDYEFTIPKGCTRFIATTFFTTGYEVPRIKKYTCKPYNHLPLEGKKYIAFGDSITADATRWRNQFKKLTGAHEIACYAIGGTTLVDKVDTILDGSYESGQENQNTVNNQIMMLKNALPSETPDFIIISAGTNDAWTAEELNATHNSQFLSESGEWLDINTIDRKKPDGAMRWQCETLWEIYPNATIIYGAPIQCAHEIHTYDLQDKKNKRMAIAAQELSCNIILACYESGIYGRYEIANANGKYLADGIHPNIDGGKKLGELYARKCVEFLSL